MSMFLTLAFLFFIGSLLGWVLELFFRRFLSDENPERKWINPGFCIGPYLPLYGVGLCVLYLIISLERFSPIQSALGTRMVLFLLASVAMTAIEYIAGYMALKFLKVRLWDYSNIKWNIQGIVCPAFSLAWAILVAVYYFLIHPHILDALSWLSHNLAFSFVIGLFFGVFIIDAIHSAQLVAKLKEFADANNVIVRYETIKTHIRNAHDKAYQKYHFFLPFRSERPLNDHLKEMLASFETRKGKLRK